MSSDTTTYDSSPPDRTQALPLASAVTDRLTFAGPDTTMRKSGVSKASAVAGSWYSPSSDPALMANISSCPCGEALTVRLGPEQMRTGPQRASRSEAECSPAEITEPLLISSPEAV